MKVPPCVSRSEAVVAAMLVVFGASCGGLAPSPAAVSARPPHPTLTHPPRARASQEFAATWYDGNAELSGYRITVPRYGELRTGELVLIYVTEPMNRDTRIKDDDAPPDARVQVLKLNANLSFLTGIYPYSVMTTVFSPVDDWRERGVERFSPVKITLTAQEWCGHVFHGVWPGSASFESELVSYFASEGESDRVVASPLGTLYEDALLIQLRELDGPFADGGDFRGHVVPSLWRVRRSHVQPEAMAATITRTNAERSGVAVTRFVLTMGSYRRTIDVERAAPRRIVGWSTSEGEEASLLDTARLPYWRQNHVGEEALRHRLGLPVDLYAPPPAPPPGTDTIGR